MLERAVRQARRFAYDVGWARLVDATGLQGAASFSFDDAPASAFESGAPILERFGWTATYYVAPGLLGQETALGRQMSDGDLVRCAAAGHEIGSHTYDHVDCRRLGRAALVAECQRGVEALGALASRNFAYPFGATDLRVQRVIGRRFDSCRGIEPGINLAATDLNNLRANAIYSHRGTDGLLALVEETARVGGWLIFYAHDVRPAPSASGVTPSDLAAVADAVHRAGLHVATVGAMVSRLHATGRRGG